MILAMFSAFVRLVLTAWITFILLRLGHMLHGIERFGLGLMGGSGFMTIAVILDFEKEGTPFDTWAGLLMSVGAVLFLYGFSKRKLKHDHANALAIDQARDYFAGKYDAS